MAIKWYIVHTYSGFEHKVKSALEERIKAEGRQAYFGQVLVPTEKVIELVRGQRKASSRKFYPGYILVQMELNDETWHLVRHTPRSRVSSAARNVPFPSPTRRPKASSCRCRKAHRSRSPNTGSRKVTKSESWTVLLPVSTESWTKSCPIRGKCVFSSVSSVDPLRWNSISFRLTEFSISRNPSS